MIACAPLTFYLLFVEVVYGPDVADLTRELFAVLLPSQEQKPALPA